MVYAEMPGLQMSETRDLRHGGIKAESSIEQENVLISRLGSTSS